MERPDQKQLNDILYELNDKCAKATSEITFGLPLSSLTGSYLQKNTLQLGNEVYQVIDILENKSLFLNLLNQLETSRKVSVFLGDENLSPALGNSALLVKRISIQGRKHIGMLGSMKMDYAFNIAALRNIL